MNMQDWEPFDPNRIDTSTEHDWSDDDWALALLAVMLIAAIVLGTGVARDNWGKHVAPVRASVQQLNK